MRKVLTGEMFPCMLVYEQNVDSLSGAMGQLSYTFERKNIMPESVLEHITKQAETLTQDEYIELLERLVHQLRKKHLSMTTELDWRELYGLGKSLWADEDAQEYVNRLREDRV